MPRVADLKATTGNRIVFRHDGPDDHESSSTGLFWLGGYKSDMAGTKSEKLAELAILENRPFLRFDYSGHGVSGGRFEDGTISTWLQEACEVFEAEAFGHRVIVGSSMGGWITTLLFAYFKANRPQIAKRIRGMVLIAPALDMTDALMRADFSPAEMVALERDGRVEQPSEYSDEPYVITRALIEDGDRHLQLADGIDVDCPVRILQGQADADVPWQHGMAVYEAIKCPDISLTLIKDGDHRLSNERDLRTILETSGFLCRLADSADQRL